MAISPLIIKRRIRSVKNTRKITRAMELVEAAKMRKSVQMAVASREYSKSAQAIITDVRKLVDPASHPLLAGRAQATSSLVIVAASDRGLCGGYNYQVLKKTFEFLKTRSEGEIRIVTVGKRAELAVKRAGYEIIASFEAFSQNPAYEKSKAVGDFAYQQFMAGKSDRVFLAYTTFKSAVALIPNVKQLLPITPEADLPQNMAMEGDEQAPSGAADMNFEPSAGQLLDALLPRLLETEIYQSLLESSASEHSARMIAMRNATDNASTMLDDLTFTFNQARQASITREISEISAGKAALE